MLRLLAERDDGYRLYEIESLAGFDFQSLTAMIDEAWKADYSDEPRLVFSEAILHKYLAGDSWLAVLAMSPAGEPVGFELGLERRIQVSGQTLRAYYVTAFSVAADHRRKGLGRWVLEGINRLVFEQHKSDLIVSTFHEGKGGSPAVQATFDPLSGFGVERFHSSPIWSRRLDKNPLPQLESSVLSPWATSSERRASGSLAELSEVLKTTYSVSFAPDCSFQSQYFRPNKPTTGLELSGTFQVLFKEVSGDQQGLVGFNVAELAINDHPLAPIAQLQFLHGPDLSNDQIRQVVHELALKMAHRGCMALTLFDMGMVPQEVLKSLGFEPNDETIHLAVRGPEKNTQLFRNCAQPYFVDFT